MTSSATDSALRRFADKCSFDAITGCVIWTGGTTDTRGGTERAGAFKFEGKRWAAHRWAAKYIHGLDIDGKKVHQTCGNSLCQQHLTATGIGSETDERYYWVLVAVGSVQLEEREEEQDGVPFYIMPDWLAQFQTKETTGNDCPF